MDRMLACLLACKVKVQVMQIAGKGSERVQPPARLVDEAAAMSSKGQGTREAAGGRKACVCLFMVYVTVVLS